MALLAQTTLGDKDEREAALLRPENMKLLNTPGVDNLYSGEGIFTVLVLLPVFNLFRWTKRRVLRQA